MNKIFIYTFGLSLLFLPYSKEKAITEVTQEHQPKNVLFIAVDDLRPELNFYGAHHIKSPNLDKLAKESLVFNRAYCNVPVCGASRASLMTGLRPARNRFLSQTYQNEVPQCPY